MTAKILVVDDLEPNVKLLEAKLLSEYYTVFTASSAKLGLEILAREKIDVVLLDVMMPEMDGFEACKLIKSNSETTHIPVVMVTALSDIEDRVKGLEAGADEFLTKPVNDTALFTRVKSLSRMKTVIDELKLRNQTNSELGANVVDLKDNFVDNHILIIDDDVVQSKNISKNLVKLTSNIKVISDPAEVDIINESYIPDVVIISNQLEAIDPLRLAVQLRAKEILRYSSLVLMTEDDDLKLVVKGMELGMNDYFNYPIDENELQARIKTQLRRKKYQDSLRSDLEQSVNLSVKDGLTGLYNRRYFDIHLANLIKNHVPSKGSLVLMMLDIDYFKKVNDTYGHQAGDEILKGFAALLKNTLKVTDLLARYGGEEFVVVLSYTSEENGLMVAERIRSSLEAHSFKVTGTDELLKKTTSIGVSVFQPGQTEHELIENADKALYESKETGRNKVTLKK